MPRFIARCGVDQAFDIDLLGGRTMVLSFLGSTRLQGNDRILADLDSASQLFDGETAAFVAVSIDARDFGDKRLVHAPPRRAAIWDFDRKVSKLFAAVHGPSWDSPSVNYIRRSVVVDRTLRLLDAVSFEPFETHISRLGAVIERAVALEKRDPFCDQAPVLAVPRVFEPEFCRRLIAFCRQHTSRDSGFMTEDAQGMTVMRIDHEFKRRSDVEIDDENLRREIAMRLQFRLLPQLNRAFNFNVTRMERFLIGRYDSETRDHFGMHRDTVTKATAHRRFAVTVALNDERDYAGGDLRFPEYGRRGFRLPLGGALVFSCDLLHEVLPVAAGERFVFLPFLYDEAAHRIRDENRRFLVEDSCGDHK